AGATSVKIGKRSGGSRKSSDGERSLPQSQVLPIIVAMLTHVVLFKFPRREDAQQACGLLLGMRGRIETLQAIEAGVDITHSPRSFDLALITRFADQAGLDAYAKHPVHLEVLAFIKQHVEVVRAVDYVSSAAG
ncbi:MAG: Dabb family protein, partial [Nannocystaceae bacterium]